jgi:hypothetical protein
MMATLGEGGAGGDAQQSFDRAAGVRALNAQQAAALGGAGGSAQNLIPRARKLTDAATLFTGQRILIVFKSQEDTAIL